VSKQHYESLAARWVESGRPAEGAPLGPLGVLTLGCWLQTDGAQREGVSPLLKEFESSLRQDLDRTEPGWLDRLLSQPSYCDRCSETYRLENLSLCTRCTNSYCYRCSIEFDRAPNGNIGHWCGGELVG